MLYKQIINLMLNASRSNRPKSDLPIFFLKSDLHQGNRKLSSKFSPQIIHEKVVHTLKITHMNE